jgi:hypothetical protein
MFERDALIILSDVKWANKKSMHIHVLFTEFHLVLMKAVAEFDSMTSSMVVHGNKDH